MPALQNLRVPKSSSTRKHTARTLFSKGRQSPDAGFGLKKVHFFDKDTQSWIN